MLVLLGLAACYAGVGDGSGAGPGSSGAGSDGADVTTDGADTDSGDEAHACEGIHPGNAPIRRLTAFEYDNTVEDLLGDTTRPASGFLAEGASGFDNNADVASVSRLQLEKYLHAAEGIAERATANLPGFMGCDPAADELGCIEAWVHGFVPRAWRRPLDPAESAELLGLYGESRELYSVAESVGLVLQAILLSPHFLYRVEYGAPSADGSAASILDYEMASRLSYLLWGSMPDAALFASAAAGGLRTPDQVEAEARRMLEHPRAHTMVRHFHRQWLVYADIAQVVKDIALYPDYGTDLAIAQGAATDALVEHVVWQGTGTLQELVGASYMFVDDRLATYYGLPAPGGDGLQRITPVDRDVAGILTDGAMLAVHAKPHETHPILRAMFVRERLLCSPPPPPPEDVDLTPPPVDPNATTRERYEQHRSDPSCSGCHALLDPLGFGFENFDATGRWRTLENGIAIDASGELSGTDVDGEFVGARGLADRLAGSSMVGACYAKQWFRYGYGRVESQEADACTIDNLQTAFAESGDDVRELLIALTQTDAFLYRPTVPEGM